MEKEMNVMGKTSVEVKERYNKKTYEDIRLRVKMGQKELIQERANELNKSLERLMNTYNVASQDYQNERNNIIDLISQFNKQSIQMYRKLIGK